MANLYHDVVFPVVVALCVIVKAEHSVVKPVVPKFCERLCNETTLCRTFVYKASDLSCHLISGKAIQRSLEEVERMYAETNMTCPNDVSDTKRKSLHLKKLSSTNGSKKKNMKKDRCRKKHCKPSEKLKAQDERSRCVLYRQENITCNSEYGSTIVNLPLIAKPGMKIVTHGEYVKGLKDSQFSLSRDDYRKKTTLPWLWFHVFLKWEIKELHVTEGFDNVVFGGEFPITDPSSFTLAIELTPNSTKLYAGKVLVQTVRPFREIAYMYFRRYKKVHFLEVLKTGEENDEMDKGSL